MDKGKKMGKKGRKEGIYRGWGKGCENSIQSSTYFEAMACICHDLTG